MCVGWMVLHCTYGVSTVQLKYHYEIKYGYQIITPVQSHGHLSKDKGRTTRKILLSCNTVILCCKEIPLGVLMVLVL